MDNNGSSQPWSIPSGGGGPGSQPPSGRQQQQTRPENQWVFRKCNHCNENFLPTDDPDFCSGECRISCSVLRRNGISS
ncbi:unnamed protein product [Sphacelaria rigidula]